MHQHCADPPAFVSAAAYVQRKGRENITTDDIVRAVRPEGRSAVPDSVKAELLSQIKTFMQGIQ
jgi:enhancer of yellow 2 transcription factor